MSLLEQIREQIGADFKLYEEEFRRNLESDNPLLQSLFEHLHTMQGKQLRPTLTLLSAKLCNGITDKTIQSAVALELIHTASLIHDDVVDGSMLRRGQPSVNAIWNNKIAVLAGDYILSRAMLLIGNIRNTNILNIVLQMTQTLASGELLELHSGQDMWISEEQYFDIIRQKTAMLFSACTEVGGASSGATPRQQSALRQFGQNLGICFQLKDDALDYSDNEDLGKPHMGDIRDGKVTLPLLISLQRAPKAEAEAIKSITTTDLTPDAEQELKSFVLRYDGLGYSRRKMEEFRAKAREALSVFHPSTTKTSLLDLVNYSINRLY